MHLFYTPDLAGDLYSLNEEESRHCLKVLRLAKGDIIHLTDGKGNLFETVIIEDKDKTCIVQVKSNIILPGKRQTTILLRKTGLPPSHSHRTHEEH